METQDISTWYDNHAEALAKEYETLEARTVHPVLFAKIEDQTGLRILDVGAGSGRDATALAQAGHQVFAVDTSRGMIEIARRLHPNSGVEWRVDGLPALAETSGRYDLILLCAVWMHVPPDDRASSFARLNALLDVNGSIYVTLRSGPDNLGRGMHEADPDELVHFAKSAGMSIENYGPKQDLLGRERVKWHTLWLSRG